MLVAEEHVALTAHALHCGRRAALNTRRSSWANLRRRNSSLARRAIDRVRPVVQDLLFFGWLRSHCDCCASVADGRVGCLLAEGVRFALAPSRHRDEQAGAKTVRREEDGLRTAPHKERSVSSRPGAWSSGAKSQRSAACGRGRFSRCYCGGGGHCPAAGERLLRPVAEHEEWEGLEGCVRSGSAGGCCKQSIIPLVSILAFECRNSVSAAQAGFRWARMSSRPRHRARSWPSSDRVSDCRSLMERDSRGFS